MFRERRASAPIRLSSYILRRRTIYTHNSSATTRSLQARALIRALTLAMERLMDEPMLFLLNHRGGTNPVIQKDAQWLPTSRELSITDAALELQLVFEMLS